MRPRPCSPVLLTRLRNRPPGAISAGAPGVQNQVMHREPLPYLHGELVVVIDWRTAGGAEVLLQRVPEDKHGKNRVHLDLRTRALGAELHRLLGLGARAVTGEPVSEAGWRWRVLADPDGNEFCVLQPPASYWPG